MLPNWGVLYCGVFFDKENLELSTDPCKITGIAKLYYNAHVTSPVIVTFLLNVFSCHFSWYYMMVFTSQKNKKKIFNVGNF